MIRLFLENYCETFCFHEYFTWLCIQANPFKNIIGKETIEVETVIKQQLLLFFYFYRKRCKAPLQIFDKSYGNNKAGKTFNQNYLLEWL